MPIFNSSEGRTCRRGDERGFTLLEILLAMIILAVGGVSIISLFAAAVKKQYDSVVDQRQALILADVVAEAQQLLDKHAATDKQPLPPAMARAATSQFSRDFEVSVEFQGAGLFPPGEGAVAEIRLFFRGRELNPEDPTRRILQRTVFTAKELESSLSYEQEKRADESKSQSDESTKPK